MLLGRVQEADQDGEAVGAEVGELFVGWIAAAHQPRLVNPPRRHRFSAEMSNNASSCPDPLILTVLARRLSQLARQWMSASKTRSTDRCTGIGLPGRERLGRLAR
jgi:hypothetical protein